eukprot:4301837-Alexandrium_andersonii.AAC.1
MSASLVGSEMCIRDRHGGEPLADVEPATGEARPEDVEYRLQGRLPLEDCLLYTSDAADDM